MLKSSTTPSYAAVGASIAYNFLVTNTGNVTVGTIAVSVTQSAPAAQANLSAVTCPTPSLAPLATETCTATYSVTQADLDHGSVADSATASGNPDEQRRDPGHLVALAALGARGASLSPRSSMAKSVTPTSIAAVGQTLTDTFVVSNSGNVLLAGVGVTDTQSAPAGTLTTAPVCQSLSSPVARPAREVPRHLPPDRSPRSLPRIRSARPTSIAAASTMQPPPAEPPPDHRHR